MENNRYIKELINLNQLVLNRLEFHQQASALVEEMGSDPEFWNVVFRRNLSDKGYLQRKWSMYEIPFLYVYECDDFLVKVHLFVPLSSGASNIAASAIHHHNNYLLTSYAAFGPGYETILFEKNPIVHPRTKEVNLKIRERFKQSDRKIHLVDAWEPHVVINPTALSATLVLWSPDKRRLTDSLRNHFLLKPFKMSLRKFIYALGLEKGVGISAQETYQYYTDGDKFVGVLEDEFFAPTRAQVGPAVDNYSVQTIFAFMQRMGFTDRRFLEELKGSPAVPEYYQKWIDMILDGIHIPDTFAKEKINIPEGVMTIEDIVETNKKINNLK